jgi:hypothetical protein
LTDTPGPLPPPPPRSGHGCIWGCGIAALIVVAAVVGTFSYLGWYLYSGFKNDTTLQMVMTTVNAEQTARSVLGDSIVVTSVSSTEINSSTETGTTASYVAHVKGSRAEGTLEATIVTHHKVRHITMLILTGPDGRRYDLTDPPHAPDTSI